VFQDEAGELLKVSKMPPKDPCPDGHPRQLRGQFRSKLRHVCV